MNDHVGCGLRQPPLQQQAPPLPQRPQHQPVQAPRITSGCLAGEFGIVVLGTSLLGGISVWEEVFKNISIFVYFCSKCRSIWLLTAVTWWFLMCHEDSACVVWDGWRGSMDQYLTNYTGIWCTYNHESNETRQKCTCILHYTTFFFGRAAFGSFHWFACDIACHQCHAAFDDIFRCTVISEVSSMSSIFRTLLP